MQYAIDPNTIRAESNLLGGTKYYDENGVYLGESRLIFFHVEYFDAAGHSFANRKHDLEEEGKILFAEHGYTSPPPRDDFFDGLIWGTVMSDCGRERKPNPIFETTRLKK